MSHVLIISNQCDPAILSNPTICCDRRLTHTVDSVNLFERIANAGPSSFSLMNVFVALKGSKIFYSYLLRFKKSNWKEMRHRYKKWVCIGGCK